MSRFLVRKVTDEEKACILTRGGEISWEKVPSLSPGCTKWSLLRGSLAQLWRKRLSGMSQWLREAHGAVGGEEEQLALWGEPPRPVPAQSYGLIIQGREDSSPYTAQP